jgi:hypothetical protein
MGRVPPKAASNSQLRHYGLAKKDARIGAGDPPRRDNTMREAAFCESIQPRWKLDKAKPKPKKQTDRHSVIDNPHRGFIGWLGP